MNRLSARGQLVAFERAAAFIVGLHVAASVACRSSSAPLVDQYVVLARLRP